MFIGFIGLKPIKKLLPSENTSGGIEIVAVEFEDGTIEHFSKLMYDATVSDEVCDLTALREKRIRPVVEKLLTVLRDWGIKLNELPYMSAVLNESLAENEREALNELWSQYMPKPLSPDEVSLVTIDRVLKLRKIKLEDVIK